MISSVPTPARVGSVRMQPPKTMNYKVPAKGRTAGATGDRLDLVLSPGDVLCVEGEPEGIMRLGATGGFFGHVLLVTSPPRAVRRGTAEATQFQGVWPDNVNTLWLVRTMESTRSSDGFHESEHMLCVDEAGTILDVAEDCNNQILKWQHPERVDVLQCPSTLRNGFRLDIMHGVLAEMKQCQANWSWSTAVRAVLFSAEVSDDQAGVMREIEQCWGAAPICSSLVIAFWQRYLCKLADATGSSAVDKILQWMPLKSDRTLPGEMLRTMEQCDWALVSHMPQGMNHVVPQPGNFETQVFDRHGNYRSPMATTRPRLHTY